MSAGPEAEFFLFQRRDGEPTTETHDSGGYFDLTPVDLGEDVRREIVLALEQMGFHVEAAHHEVAPGQHEIDFRHDDALTTADNVSTFRFVVKNVASRHGLHATFMPKPVFGINGSRHAHAPVAVHATGVNAFYDRKAPVAAQRTCLHTWAGCCGTPRRSARSPTRWSTRTSASCPATRRRRPSRGRSAIAARSCACPRRGRSTRIELRMPDPPAIPTSRSRRCCGPGWTASSASSIPGRR